MIFEQTKVTPESPLKTIVNLFKIPVTTHKETKVENPEDKIVASKLSHDNFKSESELIENTSEAIDNLEQKAYLSPAKTEILDRINIFSQKNNCQSPL